MTHDEEFRRAWAEVLKEDAPIFAALAEHDRIVDTAIHPGEVLFEEYVVPLRLTLAALAARVGMPEGELAELLNRQRAVTPEVAAKLGAGLGTSPELWTNAQREYEARRRGKRGVAP